MLTVNIIIFQRIFISGKFVSQLVAQHYKQHIPKMYDRRQHNKFIGVDKQASLFRIFIVRKMQQAFKSVQQVVVGIVSKKMYWQVALTKQTLSFPTWFKGHMLLYMHVCSHARLSDSDRRGFSDCCIQWISFICGIYSLFVEWFSDPDNLLIKWCRMGLIQVHTLWTT